MKQFKKLFASLVAVFMLLVNIVPTYAAGYDGSITINGAENGKEYKIYRILDLESYTSTSYSYKQRTDGSLWPKFVEQQSEYFEIDKDGVYVSWKLTYDASNESKKDEHAKAVANAAKAYLEANTSIQPDAKATASNGTVTFSNLQYGYYLIDSPTGIVCSLDTTDPSAEIEEKNTVPTIDKEVEEDSNGEFGESNDAQIGDTVNFKSTITVGKGAENYVLHDKMSKGLTFKDVTSVILKTDQNDGGTAVSDENYNVERTGLEDTNPCTFHVTFKQEFLDALSAGNIIVVNYAATINQNAIVGDAGNENKTWLNYGDNSTTTEDFTKTNTWKIKVLKYFNDGDKEVGLAGAKFKLYSEDPSKDTAATPIDLTQMESIDENDKTVDVYKVYTGDKGGSLNEITTNDDGLFYIEGLDSGTYYLLETEAPKGYNKITAPIEIEVKAGDDQVVLEKVENKTGAELPNTGGRGNKMLYLTGAVLAGGAYLILRSRKKEMNK